MPAGAGRRRTDAAGGSAASQAKKSHAKKRQPDLDVVMFERAARRRTWPAVFLLDNREVLDGVC
jgi:hypothetical protein